MSQQEVECRQVCVEKGWVVVAVFTDNDRSASRFATKVRPGFKALIAAVEAGDCDVVMTWESSRMQRDLAVFTGLRAALLTSGVLWWYGDRTYDMSRTRDRKDTARDAVDAEGSSDETSERVRRHVRANAVAGRPHGKLLYGYIREYDSKTKVFLGQHAHREHAAVVQECARRIAAGEALYSVARDLNKRGIAAPRSGQWQPTQVRRLCINPGYIGKRVHQGRIVGEAVWPALISEETFYLCVSRLTDPSRRTNAGRGAKHLLTGIAVCGVCNLSVGVQMNRSCLAYICKESFCVSRREDRVDALVTGVVVARLSQPDLLSILAADPSDGVVAAARGEAEEKRARLQTFFDSAAAGDLSPQGLAQIENRLVPEIEAAEKRAQRSAKSGLIGTVAGPLADEHWKSLSLEQRRELIDLLVNIKILPVGRGKRIFDPRSIAITWKQ